MVASAGVLRILVGTALMGGSCGLAWFRGDGVVRSAAVLIAVCWALATGVELVTGLRVLPVIAANLIGCPALLLLAVLGRRPWLWAMTGVEAALLVLHVWLYQAQRPPSLPYIVANDLLTTSILAILIAASLRRQDVRAGLTTR